MTRAATTHKLVGHEVKMGSIDGVRRLCPRICEMARSKQSFDNGRLFVLVDET
jgi:hypothetical protein